MASLRGARPPGASADYASSANDSKWAPLRRRRPEFAHEIRPGTHGGVFGRLPGAEARLQHADFRVPVRLMEERYRLPARIASVLGGGVDDAMQRRDPAVVGPARHEIPDVDHEGAGLWRHFRPGAVGGENFQPARARLRQEYRQAPIVGVGSRPDLARL